MAINLEDITNDVKKLCEAFSKIPGWVDDNLKLFTEKTAKCG